MRLLILTFREFLTVVKESKNYFKYVLIKNSKIVLMVTNHIFEYTFKYVL